MEGLAAHGLSRPETEDTAESCPLPVVGALTVSMDSHSCRVLPWVHTWQWRLVMGVRPAGCRCTAGGAIPESVHGGESAPGSRVVSCAGAATEAGAGCQDKSQAAEA